MLRLFIASALALLLWQAPAEPPAQPPSTLPEAAAARLARSLESARGHRRHVWRDTPPINKDGTITACIEIPRGDRQKWKFSIAENRRSVDRVLPREVGGYPVNYGFVPQTVAYDGDPLDVLVLGRALRGGALVRGAVVGILHMLHMEDEKGLDSKVILSPVLMGKTLYELTDADRIRIVEFFRRYKKHEVGKYAIVHGWGSAGTGQAFVHQAHTFFRTGIGFGGSGVRGFGQG